VLARPHLCRSALTSLFEVQHQRWPGNIQLWFWPHFSGHARFPGIVTIWGGSVPWVITWRWRGDGVHVAWPVKEWLSSRPPSVTCLMVPRLVCSQF